MCPGALLCTSHSSTGDLGKATHLISLDSIFNLTSTLFSATSRPFVWPSKGLNYSPILLFLPLLCRRLVVGFKAPLEHQSQRRSQSFFL
ncbi:hypothetical protein VN97_g575 [Penicillium thymicola]|uniref:Uncharacterized protein n=1 Tax=Penicillium thymicola TaxID=293382 RepID=A0AAI9TT70_PENTH|nr:hypothetical protein VN97_g575 [Penicillium thymicola]